MKHICLTETGQETLAAGDLAAGMIFRDEKKRGGCEATPCRDVEERRELLFVESYDGCVFTLDRRGCCRLRSRGFRVQARVQRRQACLFRIVDTPFILGWTRG